jgi:hypothetical protein
VGHQSARWVLRILTAESLQALASSENLHKNNWSLTNSCHKIVSSFVITLNFVANKNPIN